MITGYDCFGKEYGVMFKNDLHDMNSIDHDFLRNMILVDDSSKDYLYGEKITNENMENHELFKYSQRFKKDTDYSEPLKLDFKKN